MGFETATPPRGMYVMLYAPYGGRSYDQPNGGARRASPRPRREGSRPGVRIVLLIKYSHKRSDSLSWASGPVCALLSVVCRSALPGLCPLRAGTGHTLRPGSSVHRSPTPAQRTHSRRTRSSLWPFFSARQPAFPSYHNRSVSIMVSIITALVGYRTPPAFQRSGNRRIVIVRRTQHTRLLPGRAVPPVVTVQSVLHNY